NISKSELNKLKEEYAWYDVDFIVTATINKIVSKLAEKANLSSVVDVIKTAVGADSEKKEMGREIEIGEALDVAERLELEVSISEEKPGGRLNRSEERRGGK